MDRFRISRRAERRASGRLCFLLAIGSLVCRLTTATTIVPISDRDLTSRADVVVRGVVVSNEVSQDSLGRPQTVTVISPLEVLKGEVSGSLVLRELGGELSDGRFFKLFGRPEYQPGHEVVVFAIARPGGDYQTAELLLGKFEVQKDDAEQMFAVSSLAADAPSGVTVARPRAKDAPAENDGPLVDSAAPRDLEAFLRMIRRPAVNAPAVTAEPHGKLRSVLHPEYANRALRPEWVTNGLWRWNNGATAVYTLDGQANMTGGGIAQATNAAATWSAEPHSTIAYSVGSGAPNPIHMDAMNSPCGWSTCLPSGGGTIGCGGFGGGGTNDWRGETYVTITFGEVWLRSLCTTNGWDPTTIQSVLTHELGHTLGLGHSDQGSSPHDVCIGDEGAAIMRSFVQSNATLGTDDQDGVRWLYGDGGNSCSVTPTPPTVTTGAASGTGQTAATLNGTVNPNGKSATGFFQYGATASYGTTTGSQALGSGTSAVAVSAALSGLPCGTLYHFRAAGNNTDGAGLGSDRTFTTSACPPPPPAVTTNAAINVAQSSATLKGTVNPNGTATSVSFEYGTTTSYGGTTALQAIGSGSSAVAVSQAVSGLMCNSPYHFRAVATTAFATTRGLDQTFTTTACTPASFYVVTPCRIADTRNPNGASGGPALAAGEARIFPAAGLCGIPASARAIAVNLAVYLPGDAGDLRAHPAGGTAPMASSLNFRSGIVRSNSTIIPLGAGGQVAIQCDMPSGGTNVFIDVFGYFQ
jgi:hypothetical protein